MIQENPKDWAQTAFQGSEHPDTARLRIRKDYVDKITALKRENIDNIYQYLTVLLEKAKEELQHCRSSSNDHRRAMLRQHIDEVVAYLNGHNIGIKAPGRYDDTNSLFDKGMYILDEIPAFLGEVKCVIDQWHGNHLSKVHDEVAMIIDLKE